MGIFNELIFVVVPFLGTEWLEAKNPISLMPDTFDYIKSNCEAQNDLKSCQREGRKPKLMTASPFLYTEAFRLDRNKLNGFPSYLVKSPNE
jgi:hypothetical protein